MYILGPEYIIKNPAIENPIRKSNFASDACITHRPRYMAIARNSREKSGGKLTLKNFPIFRDVKTPSPFRQPGLISEEAKKGAKDDHIFMDWATATSLQVTVQASCMAECIELYDQFAVLAPLFTALTSASPAFGGYLADVDCRPDITGLRFKGKNMDPTKRRSVPVLSYLSQRHKAYNDVDLNVNTGNGK